MRYLITLLAIVLQICTVYAQSDIITQIRPAYKSFLEQIPAGEEKEYGFDDRNQINYAQLGEIFQTKTIRNDSIITVNEYRIMVYADHIAKGLLTVKKDKNGYSIVGFGANGIAADIQNQLKSQKILNPELVFIRIYSKQSDFLALKTKDIADRDATFYPLTSAQLALTGRNERLSPNYTLSDIINFNKQ